ncbi:MAG: flagellar type III secretion system pore protein FliP [Proteobacteria bacterium]|nr:flagellar type III secretion system pore protein FliP [Pseudomonadota bacterium]
MDKMWLSLAVTLLALFALRGGLKRWLLSRSAAGGEALRVRETVTLGARQQLHVVEIGSERLLVGSTEAAVTLLRELPRPGEEASDPEAQAVATEASETPASRWRWLAAVGKVLAVLVVCLASPAWGAEPGAANLSLPLGDLSDPERLAPTLQILLLLTVVSVAPSFLLMATCFTRILIVLSMLRQAIGVPGLPPNQVVAALALFTTIFVMAPVGEQIHAEALTPYLAQEIDVAEASERALEPVRAYLLHHTRKNDLALFAELAGRPETEPLEEVSLFSLLPAYMISELRIAFEIGFMIYLPFLVLDLVVASMLVSMGMIVLPPPMISLPFKLMLFVLLDGWNLVVASLVTGLR